MIQEAYVSFETAKLLKEKGFDWPTVYHYINSDELQHEIEFTSFKNSDMLNAYAAPTHQMACAWLREKGIFIGIRPRLSFTDYYYITAYIYRMEDLDSLYHKEKVTRYSCIAQCDDSSYEEAVEAALKYVLENLI